MTTKFMMMMTTNLLLLLMMMMMMMHATSPHVGVADAFFQGWGRDTSSTDINSRSAGRAVPPPNPAGASSWPAKGENDVYFAHISDFGVNNRNQRKVAKVLGAAAHHYNISAVVTGGDNFYPDGVASLRDPRFRACFEEQYSDTDALFVPWWPSLGDHDVCGNVQAQIDYSKNSERWDMPAPYYMRTLQAGKGGKVVVALLILETSSLEAHFAPEDQDIENRRFQYKMDKQVTSKEAGARQLAWIKSQASEARRNGAEWIVAVGHKPAITAANRQWRGDGATRELGGRMWYAEAVLVNGRLHDALVDAGVDVMLAGHDHSLQHLESPKSGFTTIISGAAGYGASQRSALNIDPEHESYVYAADLDDGDGGFAIYGVGDDGLFKVMFFDEEGRLLWRATLNRKCSRDEAPPIRHYRCVGERTA
mmetsp:Transcript_15909/g.40444  ORF Transcript_15909/g.40444 Transcript_15909/m.40444 type:complete len:422 (-) Transcript_15909:43-1308(-)